MNPLLSAISRYFRRPNRNRDRIRKSHRQPRRQLLCLEVLEDRLVLSPTISVANASMNEIGNVSSFVPSGSGGLSGPKDLVQGPDGNIYVLSSGTNSVIRYSPSGQLLGTFVAAGSGGLSNPFGLAFGPDGNLYVSSIATNTINEYSGSTGAFLKTFVASGTGGLITPTSIVFGPDGNLYVSDEGAQTVDRFEGPTGPNPGSALPAAGQTGANFVAPQSGGLFGPRELIFGPNGNLYVDSLDGADTGETVPTTANLGVLEYNGTTGAFITTFVGSGANGVQSPRGLAFDQDGRLYVADWGSNSILRFDSQGNFIDDAVAPGAGSASSLIPFGMVFNAQGALLVSNAYNSNVFGNSIVQYNSGVMVTLSAASSSPVTVQYTTSDGTAVAGTDYTAQTGTVTFAPGQTSRLIPLVTLYNATPPTNDYFNVQLSNPSGGTIANGNAVVTIVPPTLPQLTIGNASAIEGDPTAHYRGAAAYDPTPDRFGQVTIGPDGNIYTASPYNTIQRYNGTTGAFMGTFATGPINGARTIVFNSGYMYVASEYTNQVLQFNATTGAYVGVFVASGSGGISGPYGMTFGPNGNLYVSGRNSNNVVEYNGTTGALIGTFVAAGSGGLDLPQGITFDPSGQYLYVASSGGPDEVLKYNAQTGAYVGVAASGAVDVKFGADGLLYVLDKGNNSIQRFTENGAYVDDYAPVGSAGLAVGGFMNFGPNGDLYVVSSSSNQIYQFGTENEALLTVSLSAPFAEPVTVNYATANGTAVAGTNYTATSGTLTFAPGVTSETIRVPILDSGSQTTPLTFTVSLSNPQEATLSQSQATGTIEPSDQKAKFYVVNNPSQGSGGRIATFKYQASGTEQAPFELSQSDNDPIGVALNPAGTEEWVVDRNGNVYVYSPSGTLLGSWTPGGLPAEVSLEGITTDGTNIWLLDATTNKIFEYAGAASRLSGSQNASSSFKLNKSDNWPANLVTDGKSMWVVDGGNGKVYKYTLSGSLLGSWTIDPADIDPVGITLNPSNPSDIWIVDGYTLEVYDYAAAASRTSGKQKASATFALGPGNTDPVGIADPPTANMLQTPAASPLALNQPSITAFNAVLSVGPSTAAEVPSLASRDAAFALLAGESPQIPSELAVDVLDNLAPIAELQWTTAGALGGPNPLETFTLLAPVSSPSVHSDGSATGIQEGTLVGEDGEASAAGANFDSAGMASDAAAT